MVQQADQHPLCKFPVDSEEIEYVLEEIKEIPACMSRYMKLERLNLGSNQISKIENIDKLVNLKELRLYMNRIKQIEGLDLADLVAAQVQSFQLHVP